MGYQDVERIYLCPDCLTPGEASGQCSECGATLVECRPGESDDPCRRPLMNKEGEVLTRAPIWWLQHRVGDLMNYLNQSKESE